MKIYADTDVCAWHLRQLDLEISKEIVLDSPALFHMPFPYYKQFEDKVQYAVNVCTNVIIIVSELHQESVKFIIDHQHPKIKYFICGTIQGCENVQWMDWFITTTECYRNVPVLSQLTPYTIKPKYFDILLGWVKPHRTFVYDFINDNNLNDSVIMTYLKDRNVPIDQQGIWSANIPPGTFNTITRIDYLNYSMSLSQLIPVDIYNQTAHSVVVETNADNHYSFYTEKIVKPILAERLFVVFSGQYYLRNLRSLGFKTFDGIIDESYDSIADNDLRFKLACEQIQYLINRPQEDILAKIRPITEHNKQVMLTTDWYGDFARELRAVLLAHTD
jgi:hypothetical protein